MGPLIVLSAVLVPVMVCADVVVIKIQLLLVLAIGVPEALGNVFELVRALTEQLLGFGIQGVDLAAGARTKHWRRPVRRFQVCSFRSLGEATRSKRPSS